MTEVMDTRNKGSFRDPSGFIFSHEGEIYRQINTSYHAEFDLLIGSGLYDRLSRSGAMVSHSEQPIDLAPISETAYKVIKPAPVNFISYHYEWCFGQLKEAALLTLAIARRSLDYGMSLKDASAFNVQFSDGRAIFIDTLSFELYQEGEPWIAYRQFCQHFLAPLALMAYRDIRMGLLLRNFIDGIPLDLASKLLPARTRLNIGLSMHIHLHARSQKQYADRELNAQQYRQVNELAIRGLIESLTTTIQNLTLKDIDTEWAEYYQDTNYTEEAFDVKKRIIKEYIEMVKPKNVWDLGANDGEFSRLASDQGIPTVAFDIDHGAVQHNYERLKANKETKILPLVMDLTNPSPGLGWNSKERQSLKERGSVSLILALALVHHLAISNNVPLSDVAAFFAELGDHLIVEFIPKTDSQVERLLSTRKDIFIHYSKQGFESAFLQKYLILHEQKIPGSERILYLMQKR